MSDLYFVFCSPHEAMSTWHDSLEKAKSRIDFLKKSQHIRVDKVKIYKLLSSATEEIDLHKNI